MTNLVTLYPNQKNNISVLRSISLASQLDQFPLIPRGQLLICCSVDLVLSENAQKPNVAIFGGVRGIFGIN